VDIAVNCAGGLGGGPIASVTAQDILPTLEVSFIGAILLFKHAAAAMDNGGSMITISSLTARIPGPGLGIYSAARAGIDYILKVAAIEYAQKKIRFNSIAAGLIETDMTAGLLAMPGFADVYTQAIPAGRMGTVDDVAEAALWLADDKASGFVNGQVIDLAGGQQMGKLPG
jgi:NAD(P)-dependent dehydrogenase (short-subunit alcohol dehydrogenase family)